METVLIAGGSGTIGKHLSKKLLEKGYKVTLLSRGNNKAETNNITTYLWNVEKSLLEDESIKSADYIINLTGTKIGEKRWSANRKKEILNSRVNSNKLLFQKIKELNLKIKVFITSSAVGYYGMETSDKIFVESDNPANDFVGSVCQKWEEESYKFEKLGIRTVQIRTGVVLNKGAGALSKMMLPIKMFIGSPLGSGKQYIPWIHIEDLCNIYIKAIEDEKMTGAYNAAAPEHVSNTEFTKTLANQMNKPMILPNVPSFMLKLIFGEMANIIIEGSRVSSEKLGKAGFKFVYPNLKIALKELLIK